MDPSLLVEPPPTPMAERKASALARDAGLNTLPSIPESQRVGGIGPVEVID